MDTLTVDTKDHRGRRYALVIVDDYTRMTWVYLMKSKAETLSFIKKFDLEVATRHNLSIGTIRSDNGSEFKNKLTIAWTAQRHITIEYSPVYTPELNGAAERMMRTLMNTTRAKLFHSQLPKAFWSAALLSTAHVRNMVGPAASYFHATVLEQYYRPSDTQFTHPSVTVTNDGTNITYDGHIKFDQNDVDLMRGARTAFLDDIEDVMLRDLEVITIPACLTMLDREPKHYRHAMRGRDADIWKASMEEEMKSHYDCGTFKLVSRSECKVKPIPLQWVYKVKPDEFGNPDRAKSRLVARGDRCAEGVHYTETFAPVVHFTSARTFLSTCCQNGWEIHQMDVNTAFVNSDLDRDNVFFNLPDVVTKLTEWLLAQGFVQCKKDSCVFKYDKNGSVIRLIVYVDDLAFAGNDPALIASFKKQLSDEKTGFSMKDLGTLRYFLGMHVEQDLKAGTLKLHQRQYIEDMIKRYSKWTKDLKPKLTAVLFIKAQMDVNTAFVNSDLDRDNVFFNLPDGYKVFDDDGKDISDGYLLHAKRALYGLPQSPRLWNARLTEWLLAQGFVQCKKDSCVFKYDKNGSVIRLIVYVDDLAFAGNDPALIASFKKQLSDEKTPET
eukprot:g1237.t1